MKNPKTFRHLGLTQNLIFLALASSLSAQTLSEEMPAGVVIRENYDDGFTALTKGTEIVDAPEGLLSGAGGQVLKLPLGPVLGKGFVVPDGAKLIRIRYDAVFLPATQGSARTHYLRQYFRFDESGEKRHGENKRVPLSVESAGRVIPVELEVPVPEGATKVVVWELANIAEGVEDGYDATVLIDNLEISAE